jgi:hypothetical protein
VPVVSDIYSERAATGVLAGTAIAALLLAAGALFGSLPLLRTGGALFAAAALAHAASLAHMFLPKTSSRGLPATEKGARA